MKDRLHSEAVVEHFRADPSYAAELLAEVRRDGDPAEQVILFRQIVNSHGLRAGCIKFSKGLAF